MGKIEWEVESLAVLKISRLIRKKSRGLGKWCMKVLRNLSDQCIPGVTAIKRLTPKKEMHWPENITHVSIRGHPDSRSWEDIYFPAHNKGFPLLLDMRHLSYSAFGILSPICLRRKNLPSILTTLTDGADYLTGNRQ